MGRKVKVKLLYDGGGEGRCDAKKRGTGQGFCLGKFDTNKKTY